METVSVRCNHCGAPLNVGTQTRFVTCQFCNSQLEIKRNESSVFTEEVARIAQNTDKMADRLEVITLQNEIEQLDREWNTQQTQGGTAQGRAGAPSTGAALLGFGFAVFFALVCFGLAGAAGSSGAPGLFRMVPIGMGIFALVAGVLGLIQSQSVNQARGDYQSRRNALITKMAALKRE